MRVKFNLEDFAYLEVGAKLIEDDRFGTMTYTRINNNLWQNTGAAGLYGEGFYAPFKKYNDKEMLDIIAKDKSFPRWWYIEY